MSYQVLARKWRPKTFHEMVGQEHVLKALINALDHDRLHHAYLFTGTRGVGKTTIARVLAKCLNCDTGISSAPCNQCSACNEINEGRFVDLIEVDAASRTKVEDTRELLDNVQYAPSRGRFKVYIIDEVHMLSNSSFNALLKTLEEPPPHVKFLLATTDPQKLPVTILSRCLQFNLKNMSAERIVDYLQHVLEKEMVPFEEAALWQLGRAADGSMRDALSLTDQSIAYGGGKITDADVRAMLGTLDQHLVMRVLQGLIDEDAPAILSAVAALAEHAPDYISALAEIISVLHRIAIAQVLPEAIDNSQGDRQQIYDFAAAMAAEDVQLYYQTAVMGRRDLALIPDARGGFEMVMLRMLTFKPQGLADIPKQPLLVPKSSVTPTVALADHRDPVGENTENTTPAPDAEAAVIESTEPAIEAEAESTIEPIIESTIDQTPTDITDIIEEDPASVKKSEPLAAPATVTIAEVSAPVAHDHEGRHEEDAASDHEGQKTPVKEPVEPSTEAQQKQDSRAVAARSTFDLETLTTATWPSICLQLGIEGLLQSTVYNLSFVEQDQGALTFTLSEGQSALYDASHQERLAGTLSQAFKTVLTVSIEIGDAVGQTPAELALLKKQQRQHAAEQAILSDPVVQQLQETFGAEVVMESIKPID